ncbi:DUF3857 domain-containing protein [Aquimarina sp. 2201CG14-23]|uniref:DUF3857 domain-containing protein n=1 Tax=Aquimarina mycalae TaxID=3040073 RepID=UPI00247816C4|nr:DUF3857 domain-containing protein [Aquimarina sp. 2201CG14-23]MDH7448280.1 DUF3857 domain-containing protein [Aquimarina sp. 2201CG14-23]
MQLLHFLIYFILFSFFSYAQEGYNYKSLVVSEADVKGISYEKDSTANAFYIYEKGYSRIENGRNYNLLTDYNRKIKILNKEGFHKSKIEILLYRNDKRKETYRNLVAYTYNFENGRVVKTKLEESRVYQEEYNEHYTLIKFTFPNVKPGSVLTYSYQTESPFIFNFNGWDFQDNIPKLHSEYIADLPGNYLYNIRLVGPLKLDTNESSIKRACLNVGGGGVADCAHNQYVMRNIPAFKEEKYMTAKKNYFSRVEYELKEFKGFDGVNKKYTETWKNVDKELKSKKTIGVQLKKVNATKNVLPETIQTMPIGIDKAKAIYTHLANNYSWNGKYSIFRDVEIKRIIESKTGNVAEINILLHNTFKHQGFSVKPVLLSTRTNGYATKIHPVLSDFNYLIVQLTLDGKTHLLDATENTLAFGQIPFRCLNQYARLLDFKKGSSWINIKPNNRSSFYYKEKLTLDEALVFKGTAKYIYGGYHGNFKRNQFNKLSKEKFLARIIGDDESISISNKKVQNEDNPEQPFIEEIEFTQTADKIEDIIYLKPFIKPFFTENPFKLNERTYPVDFGYRDSYTYLVSIEIPDNYQFLDIPKNLNYSLPEKLGKLSLNFQTQGNILLINHNITFLSSYYPTDFYSSLKKFFNLIVDMENNSIITIKKNN